MSTGVRATAADAVGERSTLPPFVGRDAELSDLRQAWSLAVAGDRQIVLVSGDPGIGKTTLARELAKHARLTGGWVLTGSSPPGRAVPYAPMVDALGEAARSAPLDLLTRRPRLAHVVPDIQARIAGQPPAPDDREQLFWDTAALLGDLADHAPMLLVLDDLHRADRSTVRLLQYVLPRTADCPMLVIVAYCDTSVDRADPFYALLTQLLTSGAQHVVLPGIARDALPSLLPSPSVLDAVWSRSEGNPLFLAELLRHVDPALPRVDPRTLPRSVELGVSRRLARLDQTTRQLLAVASLIGHEFSLELVAASGEVPWHRITDATEEALDAAMIQPIVGSSRFQFTHEVVRLAVERRVALHRGVQVHGKISKSLEEHPSNAAADVARLAFHSAAAAPVGGSMSASRYAAKAGDQAMAVMAYDEAAGWYGQALGLVTGIGRESSDVRCTLLLSLADAHTRSGDKVRARAAYLEAAALARVIGDDARLARANQALSDQVAVQVPVAERVAAPRPAPAWPAAIKPVSTPPTVAPQAASVRAAVPQEAPPAAGPERPPSSRRAKSPAKSPTTSAAKSPATSAAKSPAKSPAKSVPGGASSRKEPAATAPPSAAGRPGAKPGAPAALQVKAARRSRATAPAAVGSTAEPPTTTEPAAGGKAAASPSPRPKRAAAGPKVPAASKTSEVGNGKAKPTFTARAMAKAKARPPRHSTEPAEDLAEITGLADDLAEIAGLASRPRTATAPEVAVDEPEPELAPEDFLDLPDEPLRTELDASWVGVYDPRPTTSWVRETPSPAGHSHSHTRVVTSLRARHSRVWGPEDLEDRLEASDQIIEMSLASHDNELAMEGHGWRLVDRLELGRIVQADEDIAAHALLAKASGDPRHRRDAASWSVMRALLDGRYLDARSAMADVIAFGERARDPQIAVMACAAQQFWLTLEWGSDAELAALLDAHQTRVPLSERGPGWRAALALLMARSRHVDPARTELDAISDHELEARPHDAVWLQMAACAVEAADLVGDARVPTIVAPLLDPFVERVVVGSRGLVCLGAAARYAGIALSTLQQWEPAEQCFDIAVNLNRRLGARPQLAHTQADWGSALLARGRRTDRKKGEAMMTAAAAMADEMEMRRLAAATRLRRGGR